MDVRIMDGQANGGGFKRPRVRTTRSGSDQTDYNLAATTETYKPLVSRITSDGANYTFRHQAVAGDEVLSQTGGLLISHALR
jgi:hypothetical protein